jgi:hypothetical protein
MCLHMKQTRAESPCLKLGKPDGLVWQTGLFGFVGFSGSQGHCWLWRGRPFPDQVASDSEEEQDPRQLWRLWRQLRDLIEEKMKRIEN